MERRKTVALASLLMVLLASFALVAPTSSSPGTENHRYIVMEGMACACTKLEGTAPTYDWKTPFQTRPPGFMPLFAKQNITFSDPWQLAGYGWIVNLTVPHETYLGLNHTWYDIPSSTWYRLNVSLPQDGYGWIFLNASKGDVDTCTFNNCTGVYWGRKNATFASPSEGELAAPRGGLPSPGPDGVAGTTGDGFGDGTPDPRGSSILMLPSEMHVDYWSKLTNKWELLFESPWPQVLTTGTAYDIVLEKPPENALYGWNSTEVGEPWEFLAGKHGYPAVSHGHPKWNAFVTYVCAWSVIDQPTALGELDVIFQIVERKVREDCVIADIDGTQEVDITDIVICALAFGAKDEGPGPDGKPGTADDKPNADSNYNAQADTNTPLGEIDIGDIVRIAIDFGAKLTPDCIIRL